MGEEQEEKEEEKKDGESELEYEHIPSKGSSRVVRTESQHPSSRPREGRSDRDWRAGERWEVAGKVREWE